MTTALLSALMTAAFCGGIQDIQALEKSTEKSPATERASPGPPSTPAGDGPSWRDRYEPIDDAGAHRFVRRCLAIARRWLGTPRLPLHDIALRRSVPKDDASDLRRGFCLTEIDDAARGRFTIYVSARPGERAFHGQLAHEALHLHEPRFRDVYIEGLVTRLTERLFAELELDWTPWRDHFRSGGDALYGSAYDLVTRLEATVGERALLDMPRYAVPSNRAESPEKALLRVDIDRWLDSLPETVRAAARRVIVEAWPRLEKLRGERHADYSFAKPADVPR